MFEIKQNMISNHNTNFVLTLYETCFSRICFIKLYDFRVAIQYVYFDNNI